MLKSSKYYSALLVIKTCTMALLGRFFFIRHYFGPRSRCSSWLCMRRHSKTHQQCCFFAHPVLNHCSSVLAGRSKPLLGRASKPLVLEVIARARFFVLDSTCVFPSKSIAETVCSELRIASCDFTDAVRCHTRI